MRKNKDDNDVLREFVKYTRVQTPEVPISNSNSEILRQNASVYAALGAFAERLKKIIRDKRGRISKEDGYLLRSALRTTKKRRDVLADVLNGRLPINPLTKFSRRNASILWRISGLCGELGEFAERFENICQIKNGIISVDDRELLLYELGDITWHVARLAHLLHAPFEEVLAMNTKKLKNRVRRRTIHGSGDKR